MVRDSLRRLIWTVVTLIIVSFVTFLTFYVLPPGDPAVLRAGHFPNPGQLAAIRHALGVDKPFWVQYWDYVTGIVLHLDFGYSYQYSQPVKAMIFDRLPATDLPDHRCGGDLGEHRHGGGSDLDRPSPERAGPACDEWVAAGDLGPDFWLGLMTLFLFSKDIGTFHIFDGAGTYVGLTASPGRWFGSLVLPWLVLAASLAAFYARLLRANLIEAMSEDYVRTARAKGLSER